MSGNVHVYELNEVTEVIKSGKVDFNWRYIYECLVKGKVVLYLQFDVKGRYQHVALELSLVEFNVDVLFLLLLLGHEFALKGDFVQQNNGWGRCLLDLKLFDLQNNFHLREMPQIRYNYYFGCTFQTNCLFRFYFTLVTTLLKRYFWIEILNGFPEGRWRIPLRHGQTFLQFNEMLFLLFNYFISIILWKSSFFDIFEKR